MRRASRLVAFCCVLSILYPIPRIWAGGAPGTAQGGAAPEICFPLPDGERILRDLETIGPCREAVTAAGDALNAAEVRSQALEDRVVDQDKELTDARKLIDDTRKAGEAAAKVAAGPWYSRALAVLKWVGLGIVIGFVGGMAK